ncbi:hypothetical protein AB9P05_05725 [Roseivirga sp. BDSF3-8]|uniref:hypothetical protein n=1 Tax=Roseivirga sp. BDSF3-8 TaxID=3241598 RepID=UPI003531A8A8
MISYMTFNTLSLEERVQHLWRYGTYLHARKSGENRVCLYYMENFYVEAWFRDCEKDRDNILLKLKTFSDKESLSPYLKSIKIKDLF